MGTENPLERMIPEMRRGVMQMAILSMLKEKTYGYALCKRLADGGFPVEEGTLYPILRRFEDLGVVSSSWNTDGPRPRKYYQTTRKGTGLLGKLNNEWDDIADSLKKIYKESRS